MSMNPTATQLRPLLVTTRDFFGAGGATHAITKFIRAQGVDARLLVYFQRSKDDFVRQFGRQSDGLTSLTTRVVTRLNERRRRTHQNRTGYTFSDNLIPHLVHQTINQLASDVVHLHWIGSFVPISSVPKITAPIILTLHDMWAFTGGCHYTHGCERYLLQCGCCPQLQSTREQDRSRRVFNAKMQHWQRVPMYITAPSHVIAEQAKQSSILGDKSIQVIPNPIDTETFKALNRDFARQVYDLPVDKQIILFVSRKLDARTKGLTKLIEALSHLKNTDNLLLVLVGHGEIPNREDITIPIRKLGTIDNRRLLNIVYAAADVCVVPSLQESFGQVAAESMASGTPCVVFGNTGLTYIVDHQQNGYIADPYDAESLAQGITWGLAHNVSVAARAKILTVFSPDVVAQQYIDLYHEAMATHNT